MASPGKSLGTVALATLASRILGLVRDLLMAAYFGAGRVADIFFIAFMLPNLFRRLVAEGALSVSFIPVYTESLVKEGRINSMKLASDVLVIQTFLISLFVAAGLVLAPQLNAVFSGDAISPGLYVLAVNLTRLMLPFIILSSFVSFAMGYLNSHGAFFAPAFATVLLNIGMITGIVFFGRFFQQPVYGAAFGVLLGGLLQVLLQVPYMIRHGFRLSVSFNFTHPDVVRVFSTMMPAVFGIAAFQVNAMVSNLLAAMIGEGNVSYIYYTTRLTELVFGVFIVSIGNVMLPEMARAGVSFEAGRGTGVRAREDKVSEQKGVRAPDRTMADMNRILGRSVSAALFVAVPAAAGLAAAGLPVISAIFMRGNFTYADSVMTYRSLVWAGTGLIFMAAARVLIPAFYTFKDTKIPVITAAISIAVNLLLGYVLMHTSLKHAGLTLAGCAASFVQSLVLIVYISRKPGINFSGRIGIQLLKIIISASVMGGVVFYAAGFTDWQYGPGHLRGFMLMCIICGGAVIYFLCALAFRVDEALYLYGRVRAYFT